LVLDQGSEVVARLGCLHLAVDHLDQVIGPQVPHHGIVEAVGWQGGWWPPTGELPQQLAVRSLESHPGPPYAASAAAAWGRTLGCAIDAHLGDGIAHQLALHYRLQLVTADRQLLVMRRTGHRSIHARPSTAFSWFQIQTFGGTYST
jgi:hypothetical protein